MLSPFFSAVLRFLDATVGELDFAISATGGELFAGLDVADDLATGFSGIFGTAAAIGGEVAALGFAIFATCGETAGLVFVRIFGMLIRMVLFAGGLLPPGTR